MIDREGREISPKREKKLQSRKNKHRRKTKKRDNKREKKKEKKREKKRERKEQVHFFSLNCFVLKLLLLFLHFVIAAVLVVATAFICTTVVALLYIWN